MLIVTVKEDFHESRKYDMGTNVLGISSFFEMATRPWFVQSLQQLCGDFFSRNVMPLKPQILQGDCFGFFLFMYDIQHCFICRPLDSTVLEDAGIEPQDSCDYGIGYQTL
jgi:hypothetical protein